MDLQCFGVSSLIQNLTSFYILGTFQPLLPTIFLTYKWQIRKFGNQFSLLRSFIINCHQMPFSILLVCGRKDIYIKVLILSEGNKTIVVNYCIVIVGAIQDKQEPPGNHVYKANIITAADELNLGCIANHSTSSIWRQWFGYVSSNRKCLVEKKLACAELRTL